jgi:predicted transposase YbfD/YdcC
MIQTGDAKPSQTQFDRTLPRPARPARGPHQGPRVDRHLGHRHLYAALRGRILQRHGGLRHSQSRLVQNFLRLRNSIPSHDTFNRLFAALDPQAFLDCFLRWPQSLRVAVAQEIVALDGKALRRALNGDHSVKYVVSAWAEDNGLVLGQLKVGDKSNEITAPPELLRGLELAGCIVTVDAMGTQKKIAREIIEADADYVLALKGNHETVLAEVKSFLAATVTEKNAQHVRPAAAAERMRQC